MRKTTLFILSVCSVLLGVTPASHAVQRQHRPWFSKAEGEQRLPLPSRERTEVRDGPSPLTRQHHPSSQPSPLKGEGEGDKVVQQALQYEGTRYKYGGATKRGMDCSGLVSKVWEDLKMKKIPRASSALYKSGTPVHLAELRPGDLVFFKNTYRRGISHVGVYAGNNKFVHAANRSKGVTITKLSDPYYQLHYAGARRLY